MQQQKLERSRKLLWIASLAILGVSLLCPTYCSNVKCSVPLSGFFDFTFGWFAALFMGSTYFAWFANPFLITVIFTNKKAPILSLMFSIVAFVIALTFLKGGIVYLNEAGHKGYITELQLGYWLWLASMVVMMAASTVSVIIKIRNQKIKSND